MGKSSTTTQSVTIPPEVMANYNAVNARAQKVADIPFQKYGTTADAFVAPLTQAQTQGIQQTQDYALAAQPYFQAATGQLLAAQQQGQAQTQAAYQPLMQGYQKGTALGDQAQPYYTNAIGVATPYYGAAASGLGAGLQYAGNLQDVALQQAMGASGAASGLQQYGANAITGATGMAAPANMAAMRMGLGAARQASPYYQAATAGTQQAVEGASPYQALATQAALSGSQAVSPQQFSQQAINQYMSPFMSNVVGQTMKAQAQQNAQQRQALTGDAIRAGAFGGDRAGIAQANLAYQQNLANQQTIANLLQGGYGQALGAFQQQQGVNLQAEQANRAAQQQLAQQAMAIGQQGYGQQLGAAQQMAGLGQALYGQGMTGAQTLSGLGQTQYGQQIGAAQAAAQLGQQLYGQGITGAQFLQGLGGQGFQQQLAASQQQQALGQGLAGLQFQTGQSLQGLGAQQAQLAYQNAAQQAQLAQQGYNMGANTSQALAGLGTGSQAAALQGAQAMMGAGQMQQQTEQAGKQALYNQFLQEQSYPFQTTQFLGNIAMGTGALSGSTTTTTQPSGWSDRRLKEGIKKVGETDDGLPIYKFRYKGEDKDQTHIGYMADEVEKKHPDAVGEKDGYKYVNYDKVNARESMGGAVHDGGLGRAAFAYGGAGHVDANDLAVLLAQQRQMYGPGMGGLYGSSPMEAPRGGKANIPTGGLHVPKLVTASAPPRQQQSGLQTALGNVDQAKRVVSATMGEYNPKTKKYEGGISEQLKGLFNTGKDAVAGVGSAAGLASGNASDASAEALDKLSRETGLYAHGGLIPRHGYAAGAAIPYRKSGDEGEYFPEDIIETDDKKPELKTAGSGGGGGGGKSGPSPIGLGMKAAGALANFIPGVGPFISAGLNFGSNFFNEGGVVPRQHFEQGGPEDDPHSVEATRNFLIGKESGGDPKARAKTSSAAGLGQFTDATARTVLERNPHIVEQMQQQGVQYNPKQRGFTATLPENIQQQMIDAHVAQQQNLLRQQGFEPTRENVRMNWFLGEAGGPAFLGALREDPNGPAISYAGRDQVAANQGIFFNKDGSPRTVAEVYSYLNKGGGEGGVGGGRQVAAAQGQPSGGMQGLGKAASGLGDLWSSVAKYAAPLGTGILTAASSPSPHARVAIAQGIGAGLAAMQPAEAQQQRIEQTKAAVDTIRQANIQSSLKVLPDGTKIVWLKGGKFMYADQYEDLRQQGKEPELLGYVPTNADQIVAEGKGGVGGAGGVGAGAPKTPAGSVAGINVNLSPEAIQAAREERAIINRGGPNAANLREDSRKWAAPTYEQGISARNSISGVANIAENISKNANNTGFAAMGFGADLRAQYMSFANTILRSAGEKPINKLDEANELQRKLGLVQAELQAAGGGQTSYAAMNDLLGATPNLSMTPEAATKLSADLWVARQRQIDKDNFRIVYGKHSDNSFARADTYFNQTMPMEQYQRELSAIQQVLKQDPDLLREMRSGKFTAAQIDKGFAKTLGQEYPGISRYFVSGRRG